MIRHHFWQKYRRNNRFQFLDTLALPNLWTLVLSPQKFFAFFFVISSLLPILLVIVLIESYLVNIPYWDEWVAFGPIFEKYYTHRLTFFYDFFSQYNEHRFAIPRLIAFGLGLFNGWSMRAEVYLSLLMCSIISLNLFILIRLNHIVCFRTRLILLCIINCFLFSYQQHENWLMGMQFIYYISPLMITSGLIINISRISLLCKVFCSAALSFISTYSFSSGMLVWILIFPPGLVLSIMRSGTFGEKKRPFCLLIVYLILMIVSISGYFWNFHQLPYHPSPLKALENPLDSMQYFLTWLGNILIPHGSPYGPRGASIVGGILISIFLFNSFIVMKAFRVSNEIKCFYPWIILSLYTIINGIFATIGRVGFGLEQALTSRYGSISVYLLISNIVLTLLVLSFYDFFRDWKVKMSISFIVLTILLFFQLDTYAICSTDAEYQMHRRRTGKIALQFYDIIPDDEKLKLIYPDPKKPVKVFYGLVAHGLFDVAPINRQIFLNSLHQYSDNPDGKNGWLDVCQLLDGNRLLVKGWAKHPKSEQPSDQVVLVYSEDGIVYKPLSIVVTGIKRPDVVEALRIKSMIGSGFVDIINVGDVPNGKCLISAWVVDQASSIAYQLGHNCILQIN